MRGPRGVPGALSGVAVLLLSCGEHGKSPAPPVHELAVMSMGESELYAYRTTELERMFDEAARAKQIGALPRARALTRIARVHARIEGSCGLCARAAPFIELALDRTPANDRTVAGEACDIGLDYLRVLARDSPDPKVADAFAQHLLERFASRPAAADCIAAARVLRDELATKVEPLAASRSSSLTIAPPRVQDLAMSGHEAARFASGVSSGSVVQLQSIARFGGSPGPVEAAPASDRLQPLAAEEADAEASEVRVVLAFDAPAQFRRGELPAQPDAPRRIVLDFEHTQRAANLPESYAIDAAGVARIHAFALDPNTTRVEFEVGDATQYELFFLPAPYRVVVDFMNTGAALAEPTAGIRTIVLDPGHGGVHSGARSPSGVSEAEVALNLALRVRGVLARTLPDPRVVLTREDDRVVSLEERAAVANALGADLFVSIHLNASALGPDRGGVSTYVLDATHDAQALGLAARENEAAPADLNTLSMLFGSLLRQDQVARSLELARAVQQGTLRNGRRQLPGLVDRGVRRALFYVLAGARMPAILCEASFLTRPEEAEALRTDTYRQLLADGIAEGIARYVRKTERARTVLAERVREGSP